MSLGTRLLLAGSVTIAFPFALIGFLAAVEGGLKRLVRRWGRQGVFRPWMWMIPAFLFMGTVLVYPLIATIRLSFFDRYGEAFVGLENYRWAFTSRDVISVLSNTALWIVLLPVLTTILGLVVAVLTDRVRYERIAKSIIVLPTAISFVAAGVIWNFMYRFRPAGTPQSGTLNALWVLVGGEPITWLVDSRTGNFGLIAIAVWMYLGFATLVLSAGVKGIPQELVDSAQVDGASEWQLFLRVKLPLLWPVVAIVLTTLFVWALKIFDIVFVMTNGHFGTDVIAHRVYHELFEAFHLGRGSVIAVLLFVAAFPIMVLNVRRVRRGSGVAA